VLRPSQTSSPTNASKVHPSRLGLVPSSSTPASSPLNPNTARAQTPSAAPPITQTPISADRFREGPVPVNERLNAVRPVALDLTSGPGPGHEKDTARTVATPSTANTEHRPSSVSFSPVNRSPLDSLEKLRQFKEQVAASRKSATNIEMSKLTKVAETFLESRHSVESPTQAQSQSQRQGGSSVPEPTTQSDTAGSGPPVDQVQSKQGDTPGSTVDTPNRAAARQAELKERLLALQNRGGSSQSPRVTNGTPAGPSPTTVNMKRERQDPGPLREEDEQKRKRAEAWAQHKHISSAQAGTRESERRQSLGEREEGEIDRHESRGREAVRYPTLGRTTSSNAHDRGETEHCDRATMHSTRYGTAEISLLHGDSADLTWRETYGNPGYVSAVR
jgi:hypothetical protein